MYHHFWGIIFPIFPSVFVSGWNGIRRACLLTNHVQILFTKAQQLLFNIHSLVFIQAINGKRLYILSLNINVHEKNLTLHLSPLHLVSLAFF